MKPNPALHLTWCVMSETATVWIRFLFCRCRSCTFAVVLKSFFVGEACLRKTAFSSVLSLSVSISFSFYLFLSLSSQTPVCPPFQCRLNSSVSECGSVSLCGRGCSCRLLEACFRSEMAGVHHSSHSWLDLGRGRGRAVSSWPNRAAPTNVFFCSFVIAVMSYTWQHNINALTSELHRVLPKDLADWLRTELIK